MRHINKRRSIYANHRFVGRSALNAAIRAVLGIK